MSEEKKDIKFLPFSQLFSFDETVSNVSNKKLIFNSVYLRPWEFLIDDVEAGTFRPYKFINNLIIPNHNVEADDNWMDCCSLSPLRDDMLSSGMSDGLILIPIVDGGEGAEEDISKTIILKPVNYLTRNFEELVPYLVPIKDFLRAFGRLDDIAFYVVPEMSRLTDVSSWESILNMKALDECLVVVFPRSYLPLLQDIGFDILLHPEAVINSSSPVKNPFVITYLYITKEGKVAEYRRDGILLILEV